MQVASLVPETWKADLSNPELVILVEIFKTTCGISCVTEFNKYKKFNLHELVNKIEEDDGKTPPEKPAATAEGLLDPEGSL